MILHLHHFLELLAQCFKFFASVILIISFKEGVDPLIGVGSCVLDSFATSKLDLRLDSVISLATNSHFDDVVLVSYIGSTTELIID